MWLCLVLYLLRSHSSHEKISPCIVQAQSLIFIVSPYVDSKSLAFNPIVSLGTVAYLIYRVWRWIRSNVLPLPASKCSCLLVDAGVLLVSTYDWDALIPGTATPPVWALTPHLSYHLCLLTNLTEVNVHDFVLFYLPTATQALALLHTLRKKKIAAEFSNPDGRFNNLPKTSQHFSYKTRYFWHILCVLLNEYHIPVTVSCNY